MTTTSYYLHLDTCTFSDKGSDSESCVAIDFFIYEHVAILCKSMRYNYPRIICAILYDAVAIVDDPCVMMLIRSTKIHKFADIHVENLHHLVKLAVRAFIDAEITIDENIHPLAQKVFLSMKHEFGNFLVPEWSNTFFDTVFELNESLFRPLNDNFFATAQHIILPSSWQYQTTKLSIFLKNHQNIIGISFTSHVNRFSANIQRDERKLNLNMFDLLSQTPQLKYLLIENDFIGTAVLDVAIMELDLPHLISLVLHYRNEDQVMCLSCYLNRLPRLLYLTVKATNGAKLISDILADRLHEALMDNYTLRQVDLPFPCGESLKTNYCMARNNELDWKIVHRRVLDFCIALHTLDLPPYVLLEIFDWLPMERMVDVYGNLSLMHMASHVKKIRLIIAVRDSIRAMRGSTLLL